MNDQELKAIHQEMARLGAAYERALVEAVAEAVHWVFVDHEPIGSLTWAEMDDKDREMDRELARAAIAAVHAFNRRQAQPAMHEDGYPVEEMGS